MCVNLHVERVIFFAFVLFFVIAILGIYCNTVKNKVYNEIIYKIVCLLCVLFVAFREIGIDHDSLGYYNYYNMGDEMWVFAEPTFGVISIFVKFIFNDFRFLLIIYAIIGVVLKFIVIKRISEYRWLTVLVYFSTFFLLHEFTQIRASVASGLFLLALIYLVKKRIMVYVGLILFACFWHYSALILLPLFLLNNAYITRHQKKIIALAIPCGIFLHCISFSPMLLIPIETIRLKLEIYTRTQENADVGLNVFNLVYIVKYILLYCILYYYDTLYAKMKYVSIFLKIYAFSLFLYLSFSYNTIFAMRFSELLGVVEIFLIPSLYYIIKPRIVSSVLVVLIAFIYLLINIYSLELIYSTPISYY